MSNLIRRAIDAALPEGSAWRVAPGGDLDKLLDGTAENFGAVKDFLAGLADVRNPAKTTYLSEMEREFGAYTNSSFSEQQRRDTLTPLVYNRGGLGTAQDLQDALTGAGFDVEVYQNNPAQDPSKYVETGFIMVAGGDNAIAGRVDAIAGFAGAELLVNSDLFTLSKDFISIAGKADAVAGNMTAGEFDGFSRIFARYDVPTDPAAWPLVFFVAAPGGFIAPDFDLVAAEIPAEQRDVFRNLILRVKPVRSWALLVINFV